MSEDLATVWEHLAAFRKVFIKTLLIIVLGIGSACYFYQDIINFLTSPLKNDVGNALQLQEIKFKRLYNSGTSEMAYLIASHESIINFPVGDPDIKPKTIIIPPQQYVDLSYTNPIRSLYLFHPTEGLTTSLQVGFWAGLIATSPLWLFVIARFIFPALHFNERKIVLPLACVGLLFLFLGFLFSFYLIIPITNVYLKNFNAEIGINLWSLSSYVDYSLTMIFANCLAFELAALMLILVHFKILSPESLVAKRRHMIVGAFIIGAVITPPDVLSQAMLAIPLILLFEMTILYAYLRNRQDYFTRTWIKSCLSFSSK